MDFKLSFGIVALLMVIDVAPLDAREPLFVTTANRGTLLDARLSGDGNLVASVFEAVVQIDNIETRKQVLINCIDRNLRWGCASFSPDNKRLAVGGGAYGVKGVVGVYKIDQGLRIYRSAAYTEFMMAINYGSDEIVTAGDFNGSIFHVDLRSNKVTESNTLALGPICDFDPSGDGQHMLVFSADGVALMDRSSADKVAFNVLFKGHARCTSISKDQRYLAVAPSDAACYVMDIRDGRKAEVKASNAVFSTLFLPSGDLCLYSGTGPVPPAMKEVGKVQRFDVRSDGGHLAVVLSHALDGKPSYLRCDAKGDRCLLADRNGRIEVWKTDELFNGTESR